MGVPASTCPACGLPAGTYSVPTGDYRVIKCPDCGLEYTVPIPTDEELNDFYSTYTDLRADPEIVNLNAKRNLETLKQYGLADSSTILDFGCGNAEFLRVAGERCFGVELSSRTMGDRVFENLDALPIEQFDCITLWGVLEHLNSPASTVRKLSEKLRRGGMLALTTVNAEGTIPYYYKPPEHLTYWTGHALRHLLAETGFEVRAIQAYEMCQLSAIYLNRLLSRTPLEYTVTITSACVGLPRIVTVPTNELMVLARLR